ncbi:MAG: ribonuclease Z, partial [Porphyromonas pasteri]
MGDFRVHILGCGSALPTMQHYPTAQVVELRDKLFVVDCG